MCEHRGKRVSTKHVSTEFFTCGEEEDTYVKPVLEGAEVPESERREEACAPDVDRALAFDVALRDDVSSDRFRSSGDQ